MVGMKLVQGMDLATMPVLSDDNKIRRVLHDGEWHFVVVDVVAALTGSVNPRECWHCLQQQELATAGVDLSELCRCLDLESVSGQKCHEETATLEGIFRIVQSVSSPTAEIFKRWLARVGQEQKSRQACKTDLGTIFSMLDEAATAAIAYRQNDQEFDGCEIAVRKGSRIAEEARERLEQETGNGEMTI
jgi:hypothetical protein